MQESAEKTLRQLNSATSTSEAPVNLGEGDPLATGDSSHEPHKTETGPDYAAPANLHFSSTFDEFAGIVPRDDSTFLGARGEDYEGYKRAYDFGYRMSGQTRFAKKDWTDVEPDIQREWEKDGRDWNKMSEPVRQGWEAARGLGS